MLTILLIHDEHSFFLHIPENLSCKNVTLWVFVFSVSLLDLLWQIGCWILTPISISSNFFLLNILWFFIRWLLNSKYLKTNKKMYSHIKFSISIYLARCCSICFFFFFRPFDLFFSAYIKYQCYKQQQFCVACLRTFVRACVYV